MALVARYRSIYARGRIVKPLPKYSGLLICCHLAISGVLWNCYVFHSLCIYILLYLTYLTHMISAMLPPTLILQFIAVMKKMPDSENELKEAFTAFDADGDGMFLLCCLTYFANKYFYSVDLIIYFCFLLVLLYLLIFFHTYRFNYQVRALEDIEEIRPEFDRSGA